MTLVIIALFVSNFMLLGLIANYQKREERWDERLGYFEAYLYEVDRFLGELQATKEGEQ